MCSKPGAFRCYKVCCWLLALACVIPSHPAPRREDVSLRSHVKPQPSPAAYDAGPGNAWPVYESIKFL
jgi:hypothetical protein